MNAVWRPDAVRPGNYSWAEYTEALAGVDRSVVFGIAWEPGERVGGCNGPGDLGDVTEGVNHSTAAFVRAYPDKLLGFMSVHPYDNRLMDELERGRVDLGLKGIKLGANYQSFDPLETRALATYATTIEHQRGTATAAASSMGSAG